MPPDLLLILLIVTASAALAHLLWGRRWVQIPVFWLAATGGALIALALDARLPLRLITPAGVPVLETTLGAWVMLIVASRLRL
ncbi:MAG: hypothetical protein C0183_07020 [Roseiflexus castenholzii]|uniref:hypothetical protein n=1 Tax=Roseiflexus castenholzii TaxID=120962 RepID=UPI000CC21711|nr:MAG: hypothetical protein C0183_07020 [Roseiflexus castenholzii]